MYFFRKMSVKNMKPVVNLFIFRRDLRIQDNLALEELYKQAPSTPILLLFIFNPIQISADKNAYFCANSVQFMVESLKDLKKECRDRLHFLHGYDISIMDQLLKNFIIQGVGFNADYTPFAKTRDAQLKTWCESKNIPLFVSEDYTMFPMHSITTESSPKPYEVYTPFYKKCLTKVNTIRAPSTSVSHVNFYEGKVSGVVKNIDVYYGEKANERLKVHGGRENAREILARISRRDFLNYASVRDFPALDRTTKLSAYLKFGCVSIREVFDAMKKAYGVHHGLVRELFWREFYAHITYHYPKILDGQIGGVNHVFKERYEDIKWEFHKDFWERWCVGKTGFPLVDAGMRQLNTTGYQHNRCRMITSMFLTKDLAIDWRKGEKYFAQHLVDYDPASNNGGWQWCSSTGTDSQPYFRVLSPMLQAQRFDKDVVYIREWIPELRNVPAKDILNWDKAHVKYPDIQYPKPIVKHREQVQHLIEKFRDI